MLVAGSGEVRLRALLISLIFTSRLWFSQNNSNTKVYFFFFLSTNLPSITSLLDDAVVQNHRRKLLSISRCASKLVIE